jgi:hypothetical protein
VTIPHNKGGIMGGRHQNFEDPITWARDIRKTKFDLSGFFGPTFSWVKMKLHTKNELPWLSLTALIVMDPVWWCGGFLTDNNTTSTKVAFSCFGLLVELWQF